MPNGVRASASVKLPQISVPHVTNSNFVTLGGDVVHCRFYSWWAGVPD